MKQEEQNTLAKDSTNAPYWACWPLHLSAAEIKAPQMVIDSFFQHYTLSEIRMLLQDWLSVVFEQKAEAAGYVSLCRDVERLIEAVFMTQENALTQRILQEVCAGNE